jgi:inhibitor of KinA
VSSPAPSLAIVPAELRLFPLGDAAIVLEFGDRISPATHRTIEAVRTYLSRHPFRGLRELVPAFTTLTIYYNPWLVSKQAPQPYEWVAETIRKLLPAALSTAVSFAPVVVEIPVCYGGAFGPDLDAVATHSRLPPEEVIRLHAAPSYLVHMIGFAPGFPYLGGLDERLATPRQARPRPLVPAGSVGIAGPQTGIYSLPTPGGWQLIGRTPLRLFDPDQNQPSLLQAGEHLRFVPISEADYHRQQSQP